ncbi:MAG: hypothetical protein DI626_00525 [Micavibrio aeruginosavorus]|uniref:Low temperature requirement protein A n=1 Tax=Micavibrio aeruginosavorus TaxID=349221 RepID=A0A2W5C463_9BACT|nr:MAG: hypothetical protein DI626_00525 [Micavibrio aeruginosavorus]
MSSPLPVKSLLRARAPHTHTKVTYLELFFDLVFVFGVTQISHFFLKNLTIEGGIQAGMMVLAVWWVWGFTSWVTNWLDPEKMPVRLFMFALMLAGLVLSTSVAEAFGDRGLIFAAAYMVMQVGRSLFTLFAVKNHSRSNYRNFIRITAWLSLSGVFWITGAFAEGPERMMIWGGALLIEYLGPISAFWVPGLGGTRTDEWDVEGAHMSERCALFIIIALGESILVTGATFAHMAVTLPEIAAFLCAFVSIASLWWIYFDAGADDGAAKIAASEDPGKMARLAYTYIHAVIVAGIILSAVGDEMVLAHASGHVDPIGIFVILGGPALFLTGTLLFKRVISGRYPLSHVAGLGLTGALIFAAPFATPLLLAALATGVLVLVAVWEKMSLRTRDCG